MKTLKIAEKQAIESWNEQLDNIRRDTEVSADLKRLSHAEREKRRKKLEGNPLDWIKEIFGEEVECDFAAFQKKAIHRILNNHKNWYEVLSWSRELAKSTIVMYLVLYLILTDKKKNVILTSYSLENAVELLNPYRAQLEANHRLHFYYGEQTGVKWKESRFVTQGKASFKALGAGQSPRGKKNANIRTDIIIVDDFDTDEECRNPEVVNAKWNWFEQALYFTRSFSKGLLTIFCGNIIAPDCCIVRAGQKATELAQLDTPLGNWDIVNIRMVNINRPDAKRDFLEGTSVWPEKNSEEDINMVLAQVSAASAQKECFNNPVSEGKIFKNLVFGKVPPLSKFKFLVAYGDPAPGENKGKKKSYKGVSLVGRIGDKYYVIKTFLDQETNAMFMSWYFELGAYVAGRTNVYNFIENNSLQDPFFQQVYRKLFREECRRRKTSINISPDEEKKTDKATRIEANLEPLDREGRLIFNEEEKTNPHMARLIDQFKLFDLNLPVAADGPDAVEGAKRIIDKKMSAFPSAERVPVTAYRARNRYRM
ncbi:MAG: hypothetical protein MdMp024_0918 [Bacteroidales bacterium]